MKASQISKKFIPVPAALIVLCMLFGCFHRDELLPAKPFPHEGKPQGAEVTLYFNARGDFFVDDKDGNPVAIKPIPFSELLTIADKKTSGWIELLGSYTIFQVNKGSRVFLCDKEYECIEGLAEGKSGQAVFSVNYDRDANELFIADRHAERVDEALKASGKLDNKSKLDSSMISEMKQGKLEPFTYLIEHTDLSSADRIKALRTFLIFRIRGSYICGFCDPNSGFCYYGCMDSGGYICGFDYPGHCPDGLCPQNPNYR
jgi:hypothetical protein